MKSSFVVPALLCACVCTGLLHAPGLAQMPGGGVGSGGGGADRIDGRAKFVPIPYVDYDRSLGFAIGFIPMVMFNPVASDTLSPSSVAGGMGMLTTNETWFAMGFALFYFDEDKWRLTTAGGSGSINFQFYLKSPVDQWIPYNTAADFGYVGLDRRVWRDVFVGASYIYMKFDTTVQNAPGNAGTTLHGLGLKTSLDQRSSVYYPRSGFLTNIEYITYPSGFGNEFESNVIEIDYNFYVPLNQQRDVLATRFYSGIGIGDLSFNQQFIVGGRDIRGYTQGGYRGNYLVAAQSEYRWNPYARFGLVGFFGLATVFEGINPGDDGKLLPGIGVGFRYTAVTDTHMNVGMDLAVGSDDWGVYFRLGEAY